MDSSDKTRLAIKCCAVQAGEQSDGLPFDNVRRVRQ